MSDDQAAKAQGSRILVIDDEEVIHRSLQRILGRQGHEVDAVLTALRGIEKLQQGTYDLVISDLMMPEVNGIDLLRRMRDLELHVPVMMITGYPSIKTAVQALRLGAVDYLAKPFTRQELLGPVNRTLRALAGEPDDVPPAEAAMDEEEALIAAGTGLAPGDKLHLRKHSWAVCQGDGTVRVGIEGSFLRSLGTVTAIDLPGDADLVEQGFPGIHLRTAEDEEHSVFMPLSGQVMAVNLEVQETPALLDAETWLVQLQPVQLDTEISMLSKGRKPA